MNNKTAGENDYPKNGSRFQLPFLGLYSGQSNRRKGRLTNERKRNGFNTCRR